MTDYDNIQGSFPQSDHTGFFVRPRINTLLAEAIKKPLALMCAGMGYGKTIAVSDFVRETEIPAMWMQMSEFDNVGVSFWENFTRAQEQLSKPLAEECRDLGFPDTEDKLNQFFFQRNRILGNQRYLVVLDDVHLIKDLAVIHFLENIVYKMPPNRTVILICREMSQMNLAGMQVRGLVANINETDLNFTESELAQYLMHQGLSSEIKNLPEIFQDTEGWAFIINFLVRILKKSPGYSGYVRNSVKQNIFLLMEMEAWDVISERLQRFLVRLSLVDRPSAELVSILAEGDEELLAELNQQRVVYLRFDGYTGSYLIHHLFLDYLHSKQDILSPEEVLATYKTAAEWSVKNDLQIDALLYYEKIGDYESIVSILIESPIQQLLSVTQYLMSIFARAPAEIFDKVEFFACAHVRIYILAYQWPEALELLEKYEKKFLGLPDDNEFRNHSLGVLYYLWGILRQLMCTVDDNYNFDAFYEKMTHFPMMALPIGATHDSYPLGPWLNRAGVSRQGAPQEYLEAIVRSSVYISKGENNWMEGLDDLGRGELLFYQGEINMAKPYIAGALERALKGRRFVNAQLALFYSLRIGAYQGDYAKMEKVLKDMETLLEENEYYNRFSAYDISLGWFYYTLRQPEKIPGWLKGRFSSSLPTNLIDNFGNQMKARYYYMNKNYDVLLAHIEESKLLESTLYGRVETLAMEACSRYQMKDKAGAYAALLEAYEASSPNGIMLPFIEMGKDMRTLTLASSNDPDCLVPAAWQKIVNKKASMYARYQTKIIAEFKNANDLASGVELTHREMEVLLDLNKGFSRSEIAANQGLSINTVRLVINTIYEKLKARNIADLIRIAHEQKLL